MQYYLLMDAYGNVPFSESMGKPEQKSRKDMYEWLQHRA
jgi:starch-binding outer membrane protein, SusD/RagB family